MATPDVNDNKYWFEGLVIPGLNQPSKNTADNKYWFEGLVTPFLASYAATTSKARFFVVFID